LQKLNKKNNLKIGILIGPEGGIEKEEIEFLKQAGAKIVTLGTRILRTETAPIVMSSVIMYELDEM
ncbi:MAG: RsmE family RNA methyltransferase, partial [Clostridia bacterium]|nr:RsmE family RNA methyltransferase [Clostridia bacterium]